MKLGELGESGSASFAMVHDRCFCCRLLAIDRGRHYHSGLELATHVRLLGAILVGDRRPTVIGPLAAAGASESRTRWRRR